MESESHSESDSKRLLLSCHSSATHARHLSASLTCFHATHGDSASCHQTCVPHLAVRSLVVCKCIQQHKLGTLTCCLAHPGYSALCRGICVHRAFGPVGYCKCWHQHKGLPRISCCGEGLWPKFRRAMQDEPSSYVLLSVSSPLCISVLAWYSSMRFRGIAAGTPALPPSPGEED